MMEHGHSYFPASSLDPYTRLLASLADLVTKARQSLHRTSWGSFVLFFIVGFVLFGVWAVLLTTSILWAPLLFIVTCTYGAAASFRVAVQCGGFGVRTVRDKTRIWGRIMVDVVKATWHHYIGHNHSHEESHARAGRDLAMKDQGFMRALFDALPGVDPEKALERVDSLPNFSLAFPGDADAAARRRYGRGDSGLGEVGEEEDDILGCVSPMEELFAKGLLERLDHESLEEQASWQAGRAFIPLRHAEPMPEARSLGTLMEAEAAAANQAGASEPGEDSGWKVDAVPASEAAAPEVLRPRPTRATRLPQVE